MYMHLKIIFLKYKNPTYMLSLSISHICALFLIKKSLFTFSPILGTSFYPKIYPKESYTSTTWRQEKISNSRSFQVSVVSFAVLLSVLTHRQLRTIVHEWVVHRIQQNNNTIWFCIAEMVGVKNPRK